MYKHLYNYVNYRIVCFAIALTTIFLAISLWTYSPYDPSWFYYTTGSGLVHNQLGVIGSYTASALLYFLGGAAYLLVVFGAYLFWAVARGASLRDEWERCLMFGLLICACALLQRIYTIDLVFDQYPGGMLGQFLSTQLFALMDPVIVVSLTMVSMWISFVLITRVAFVPAVHYGVRASVYISSFISRIISPVTQPIIYALIRVRERMRLQIKQYMINLKQKVLGVPLAKKYESASEDTVHSLYDQPAEPAHPFETSSTIYEDTQKPLAQEDPYKQARQEQYAMPDAREDLMEQVAHTHYQDPSAPAQPKPEPIKPYELPPNRLFTPPVTTLHDQRSQEEVQARARILEEKLECFGIAGSVVSIKHGPVVTLFEYQPAINTKISKIMSLEDDLALALQAMSIRIIAPVPGTPYVGFEVANKDRKSVPFASLARSEKFNTFGGNLPLILGENTIGGSEIVDLASMPHLLIAGSTGSGKSVALNTMLISLLCKCTPEQLRMILVDPKRLEFASYADLPHLLFPIITDPKKSIAALKWVVQTMEERYEQMAQSGVRNIVDYNNVQRIRGEKELPFIVVVIDELADLMMTAGKEIEGLIVRVAQMARASGIHMILATQRPSVDVITGLIKVNFPSRISCRVTSKVDSRTILDSSGAEKLLGKGDMLFLNSNSAVLQRVHGAYISDEEIQEIANHIRAQRPPSYIELNHILSSHTDMMHDADDELYQEILAFLETIDEISISLLQRRFRIGYNRSARIIDILETQGHISMSEGSKMRKVVH